MTSNYELKIISRDEKSEGKVLKKYVVDGKETVGVHDGEPFEIEFKNKTWNKVQVKISIDGTDISTGSLASTSPDGSMWFCEPYGTIKLKAWPESTSGGSEFLFSKAEDSVAANTHGDMSNKGIIAAAVFIEGNVNYTVYNTTFNSNSFGVSGGNGPLRGNSSLQKKWIRPMGTILNCESTSPVLCSSSDLAVGAGDYVSQTITTVPGLIKPILSETILVRYESWMSLRSKVRALQKTSSNESKPGFPGDASINLIDLKTTPKGRKKSNRKSLRTPDLQRF